MSKLTIIAIILLAVLCGGVSLWIGLTVGVGWQLVWLAVSVFLSVPLGRYLADREFGRW